MQTVPNWQAMAQNYYFAQHPLVDSLRQMHLNRCSSLQDVHFQREGVVSYYNRLMARGVGGKQHSSLWQLKCRKMAEAQFGQFLIGIV